MYAVIASTQPSTPPESAPVRAPGRPRRRVELAAPAVSALVGSEHADALRALSSLLVETTAGTGTRQLEAAVPLAGTAQILDALSSADGTMPSRPTAQRRSAA
jgi:hypothetical protein